MIGSEYHVRRARGGGPPLEAAGITPGTRGLIPVDAYFRAAVPHVYAASDVVGPPALAATGIEQARVAACHAFGSALKEVITPLLPAGVYTIPNGAAVGETEESLRAAGVEYVVGRATYAENPRGKIIGCDAGFLKLLFRAADMRLVGVHVHGHAGRGDDRPAEPGVLQLPDARRPVQVRLLRRAGVSVPTGDRAGG